MAKKLEKSGNFVSPEKWEPCITNVMAGVNVTSYTLEKGYKCL